MPSTKAGWLAIRYSDTDTGKDQNTQRGEKMKSDQIDHIHVKVNDMKSVTSAFEDVLGKKMDIGELDFTADNGLKVSFNGFPNGLEIMEVTDKTKEMAALYDPAPEGIFAISLKVDDIEKATADMESMGHKMLMRYDFGEIKEALFDTQKALKVYVELIEYPTGDIMAADSGGVV